MNCSRCGANRPNPSCYVCWEEPPEEDPRDFDDDDYDYEKHDVEGQ
jgi:hypothetical protein